MTISELEQIHLSVIDFINIALSRHSLGGISASSAGFNKQI